MERERDRVRERKRATFLHLSLRLDKTLQLAGNNPGADVHLLQLNAEAARTPASQRKELLFLVLE